MSEFSNRPHKAICADGVIRTAYVRSYWDGRQWCMHSDTFFSVPAFVRVKGKRVSGYVTRTDPADWCKPDAAFNLEFCHYRRHDSAVRSTVRTLHKIRHGYPKHHLVDYLRETLPLI